MLFGTILLHMNMINTYMPVLLHGPYLGVWTLDSLIQLVHLQLTGFFLSDRKNEVTLYEIRSCYLTVSKSVNTITIVTTTAKSSCLASIHDQQIQQT
jgi:hypothetical protein